MQEDTAMVSTIELDFCYNTGRYALSEAIGVFSEEVGKQGVFVAVVSTHARDAGGWPTIRLYGPRAAVRAALKDGWNDGGSDAEELEIMADMYLGDPLATHRWNTGCRLGLPVICPNCREAFDTDYHICALQEPCEVCGSRSINRKGDVLHTEEDCFK